MKTIRDMVDEKMLQLRDIDSLDPRAISEILIELSSLWGNVNKELVERKFWYAQLKQKLLMEYDKASFATIHAEASKEYHDYLEADSYAKSVQETIRTGKKFLNLIESESRESMR